MRFKPTLRRYGVLGCSLCLTLCLSTALAVTPLPQATVQEVRTEIGENVVAYPQLDGLADEAVQTAVNNAIVEKADIAQRMVTLATLPSGGSGLTVTYDDYLGAGIFSTAIHAHGMMENGRSGDVVTALCFDLATGQAVTLSDLFTEPQTAVAEMETILTDTYADELSNYLENSELTPLPTENFMLDADGITFYYPYRQFALLSGYAGAAQFNYDELTESLLQDPTALPARLQAFPTALTDQAALAAITDWVKQGRLPHVPVALGDAMPDALAHYRLLREPDQYPGGRYCQLEAPMFRRVLVLTDALTTGCEGSQVTGLMSFRADLCGLRTGFTPRERWLTLLGEPESTVEYDAVQAADYSLPAGTADYYAIKGRQLMLYADTDGLLYAVRLTT